MNLNGIKSDCHQGIKGGPPPGSPIPGGAATGPRLQGPPELTHSWNSRRGQKLAECSETAWRALLPSRQDAPDFYGFRDEPLSPATAASMHRY